MLKPEFFEQNTIEVARQLIGAKLYVLGDAGELVGRIVETEAYLGSEDPASHAANGPTPRSSIMFGPAGMAYVYFIYGVHHCLNVVTEADGQPGAVLIRALEPVRGQQGMARSRGLLGEGLDGARFRDRDLCNGPGKLCQALGLDISWNGAPLNGKGNHKIWITRARKKVEIVSTPRIGIRKGTESHFRFVDPDSFCLSR